MSVIDNHVNKVGRNNFLTKIDISTNKTLLTIKKKQHKHFYRHLNQLEFY